MPGRHDSPANFEGWGDLVALQREERGQDHELATRLALWGRISGRMGLTRTNATNVVSCVSHQANSAAERAAERGRRRKILFRPTGPLGTTAPMSAVRRATLPVVSLRANYFVCR